MITPKNERLVIHKELLPINEFTRPGRKLIDVRGVVIHWTGNPSMDARAHVRYFQELSEQKPDDDVADRYASAHYFIGTRGDVHQLIPEDEVAYHVGGKEYFQAALDKFDCTWPNGFLIGLELCHSDWSGEFTDETIDVAQRLTRRILDEYDLKVEHVVRHYHITGKLCPKWYCEDSDAYMRFIRGI